MRGFTLIEISIIILIITILTSISLKFTVFSGDTLYLKNFVYRLASNINLLKDFSLGRRVIVINGVQNKACGYGLLMTPSSYYAYAYVTSSPIECDFIALLDPQAFRPSSPLLYLHTNGDIRELPIEPLQIKDNFQSNSLNYFRISLNSPNCSDNLFSLYSQIALIYYNPYGDILLLEGGSWNNLLSFDWDNIYLCFRRGNEEIYLRINRSGQALLQNF